MKKQSMFSRLFAVLMAVLMVCTVVPAASFSYAAAAKTTTTATAAKKISKAKVTYTKTLTYTGKAKRPNDLVVTYGKKTLKKGRDYTVSYKNNTAIGVASIVIKAKAGSGYTGSKTVKFKIVPARVKGLTAAKTTKTAVKLTWNAVKGAKGYIVYRYDAKTKTYTRVKVTKKLVYIVRGLDAGTVYRFAVRAYMKVDGKNYYGTYSKVRKVKTLAATPATPTTPTQPTTPTTPTTPTQPTTPTTPTTPTDPTNPTNPTNPTTPTTPVVEKPAKVTGLQAAISDSSVTITWNAVNGAVGYQVYRYLGGTSYQMADGTVGTSATINGLDKDTPYQYAVRAYVMDGTEKVFGDYSELVTVTIVSVKPVNPQDIAKVINVEAKKTGAVINLSWSPVNAVTGYEVATVSGTTYTKVASVTAASAKLDKLPRGKELQLVVRAYVTQDGKDVFGPYSDPVSALVYNAEYYAAAFKSGTYTVGMKMKDAEFGELSFTAATKNGNKNMKATMPMPLDDTTTINAATEIRVLKPSGDVKEEKTYLKLSIPAATLAQLALKNPEYALFGMFNDVWMDGTAMMGDSEDMLAMIDVLSALELDDLSKITVSTKTVDGKTYDVETVTGKTSVTELYFQNDELKRVAVSSGASTTSFDVTSFSPTASDSLFERPKDALPMNI